MGAAVMDETLLALRASVYHALMTNGKVSAAEALHAANCVVIAAQVATKANAVVGITLMVLKDWNNGQRED